MFTVPLYFPRQKDIPNPLLSLTQEDIDVLRPFYPFFEQTERKLHGYQVKCCPIKLRTSQHSVQEKISELTDANRKLRCQNLYDYLMASDVSSYSHFV